MSNKEDFLAKCLVLDVETNTNQHADAKILEAGFVIRENDDWVIFQELHSISEPVPPKISSITYITDDMVADKPSFIEVKGVFQSVVDTYFDGFLVAHNCVFDMKVLQNNGIDFQNYPWICTYRLAKKLFNNVGDIGEFNLPYLRYKLRLAVPADMRAHRAGSDSYMTGRLLEVLVGLMEDMNLIDKAIPYGPQIVEYLSLPIIYLKMPFGKHKDKLMVDVPLSYWAWCMNNMDILNDESDNFDSDFAASVALVLDEHTMRKLRGQ